MIEPTRKEYVVDPITKLLVPRQWKNLSRELELEKHKLEIKPRKYKHQMRVHDGAFEVAPIVLDDLVLRGH